VQGAKSGGFDGVVRVGKAWLLEGLGVRTDGEALASRLARRPRGTVLAVAAAMGSRLGGVTTNPAPTQGRTLEASQALGMDVATSRRSAPKRYAGFRRRAWLEGQRMAWELLLSRSWSKAGALASSGGQCDGGRWINDAPAWRRRFAIAVATAPRIAPGHSRSVLILGDVLEAVVRGPRPGPADTKAKVRQNLAWAFSVTTWWMLPLAPAALAPFGPAAFAPLAALLMATSFDHGVLTRPCPRMVAATALPARGRFLVLEGIDGWVKSTARAPSPVAALPVAAPPAGARLFDQP